jgi:hypothetical protein
MLSNISEQSDAYIFRIEEVHLGSCEMFLSIWRLHGMMSLNITYSTFTTMTTSNLTLGIRFINPPKRIFVTGDIYCFVRTHRM